MDRSGTAQGGRGHTIESAHGELRRSAGGYNAYQPTRGYQRQLYVKYGLGLGRHTITVRKTGGTYMELDAIRVTQDNSYDDPSASYTRGTGWVNRQNSTTRDYGYGTHYTRYNNASAWIRFSGTQVALMSPTGRYFGWVRVTIDGRSAMIVSAYRAEGTRYQQIIFSRRGLAPGAPTMKITKLNGTYMELDAVFSR